MEELLIKLKDKEESSFIKDLLTKLKIKYVAVGENEDDLNKEVKQSVINGQSAYKDGATENFKKIASGDLWK